MSSFVVHLKVRVSAGTLFASCPEVPGLHVRAASPEALRTVAIRAVKDLYARNRKLDVDVSPTDDLAELRVRIPA